MLIVAGREDCWIESIPISIVYFDRSQQDPPSGFFKLARRYRKRL
jgi:hypothetical protein